MPDQNRRVARSGASAGLGAALVLIACGSNPSDSSPSIRWHADIDQAITEARARDLPVWVQFTGPWCQNCRRLERDVFTNPEVVASARERFVPVKLRSDAYEAYAHSLGLSVLPSTVILHPNGELLGKLEGY